MLAATFSAPTIMCAVSRPAVCLTPPSAGLREGVREMKNEKKYYYNL